MRQDPTPRWWTAWFVFCVLFGAAFMSAVVFVAWHFAAKYW